LTLFVVPLVYTVFNDVATKIRKNPEPVQA